MDSPYIGTIMQVAFPRIPRGWASCNGQLLSIAQNQALFALLGTTYGGDGVTTFALPDLRSRTAIHRGQAPGQPPYQMGQASGEEQHTLIIPEMPMHNHLMNVSGNSSDNASPAGNVLGTANAGDAYATAPNATMAQSSIQPSGGNQPHNNLQPYLTTNFVIALAGIFPSRS